jgi:hypothetical protein
VALAVGGVVIIAGTVLGQRAPAADPARVEIAGLYACEGGADVATCVIRSKGEAYTLRWAPTADARTATRTGIGLRDKDVLAVSWRSGDRSGVALYRIAEGPRLTGRLVALRDEGETPVETLTFQRPIAEVPAPRPLQIGDTVWANWTGDEYCYSGTVAKIDGERCFVCHDDEGWFWYGPEGTFEDDVKEGSQVFAKLTKRPDYRPATVVERKDRMFKVRFEDGEEVTTTINFIRVLR